MSNRVRRSAGRRRGISYLLALLYLVLFAAVSLGFFAQTNLGAQVAANEQRVLAAQVAAESGLQFVRYQLSKVKVAPTVARERVLEEVYNQLSVAMDGTGNLGPRRLGYTPPAPPGAPAVTPAINIPAGAHGFIPLGCNNGSDFRVTLTETAEGFLRVKATGRCGGGAIVRAILMDFEPQEIPSNILSYGVATRGNVRVGSGEIIGSPDPARASILCTDTSSTSPVSVGSSHSAIGGDVYLENRSGSAGGSGTIAGADAKDGWGGHVHPATAPPEFPSVDPLPFMAFLAAKGETLVTGSLKAPYLSNIRIRAGADPTFSAPPPGGTMTIEGVVLIEAPNRVTFGRGVTVRGVIVVPNPAEGSNSNEISFDQGASLRSAATLPESFGALRTMTTAGVLAPNFLLDVSGGSSMVGGCVIAGGLSLNGGSAVTVDGSVVLCDGHTLSVSGGSTLTITGTPPATKPVGLRFSHTYVPHPATYLEVAP